jgi:hypothetical protein
VTPGTLLPWHRRLRLYVLLRGIREQKALSAAAEDPSRVGVEVPDAIGEQATGRFAAGRRDRSICVGRVLSVIALASWSLGLSLAVEDECVRLSAMGVARTIGWWPY